MGRVTAATEARPAPLSATGRRRLGGVDLARAVAVFGMLVEHTLQYPILQPKGALWVVYGRSALLFVLLAGAGVSLATRPGAPRGRLMVAVRAPLLLLVGMALSTQVDGVILQSFALFFLIGAVTTRFPRRVLAVGAGVLLVGGPLWLTSLRRAGDLTGFGTQDDVGFEGLAEPISLLRGLALEYYPAVFWLGFFLAGMVLGRTALLATAAGGRRLFVGAGIATAALLTEGWAGASAFGPEPFEFGLAPSAPTSWSGHWTTYGFSDAVGWTLSATALALTVVGGCVWLAGSARRLRPALAPFMALGTMSLTFYVTHFLYLDTWWVSLEPPLDDRVAFLSTSVAFWVAFGLLAQLWLRILPKGPLELVLHAVSSAVVRPARP